MSEADTTALCRSTGIAIITAYKLCIAIDPHKNTEYYQSQHNEDQIVKTKVTKTKTQAHYLSKEMPQKLLQLNSQYFKDYT